MKDIRELRRSKNLTQRELGDRLNVGQTTVAMWETGDRTPRADKLPELAKILGCRIDDLFEKEGRKWANPNRNSR